MLLKTSMQATSTQAGRPIKPETQSVDKKADLQMCISAALWLQSIASQHT